MQEVLSQKLIKGYFLFKKEEKMPRLIGTLRLIGEIILRLVAIATIIGVGFYLGHLLEAFLTLIAFFQFELASRQLWLHKALSEPLFAVWLTKESNEGYYYLTIENVGSTPAYMVMVSRIIGKNGKPISPEEWSKHVVTPFIACLKTKESPTLAKITAEFYHKYLVEEKGIIEVSYTNLFDEWKSFWCSFTKDSVIPIHTRERPPGFLLTLPDYIGMLKALYKISKSSTKKE
jgi:hypothetical protein